MDEWRPGALTNLVAMFANLYPTEKEARRVSGAAGLNTDAIDFDGSALDRWDTIVHHADARRKVDAIIQVALAQNHDHEGLKQARDHTPPPAVKEPPPSEWSGPNTASSLERIMGERSTLVPIAYLEVGLARARSVVRIKMPDGSSGSGFVTTGGLLVTNNHVVPDVEAAKLAVVQFNYQQTADGLDAQIENAQLSPEEFFKTSKKLEDDWTIVKLAGQSSVYHAIPIMPVQQVRAGDYVNIIQHPGGGPKQISLSANVVVYEGNGRVQYLTDTLPGSSGSPVFDAKWNVVALHHSGGWLIEPNAAAKGTFYRNEGISIDRIAAHLP